MSAFREKLGQSESSNSYSAVNEEGYTGKYQFGPARLADYMKATGNKFTMDQFKNSPALQERVQKWHEGDILDYVAAQGLDQFIGKTINGVKITPTAMLGMAHLGGKAGMKKFLETGGEYNPADSNGTTLRDYGQKFGGQDRTETARGTRPSEASKGIIPQADQAGAAADFERQLAALFKEDNVKFTPSRPPSGRYGQSGRMSPLSGSGIPGLGMIKQYSTPGGIESLYRKR